MKEALLSNLKISWSWYSSLDVEYGYVRDLDLEYPEEFHDEHNDFPLTPEKKKIDFTQLGSYQRSFIECLAKLSTVEKLVPNFLCKKN